MIQVLLKLLVLIFFVACFFNQAQGCNPVGAYVSFSGEKLWL